MLASDAAVSQEDVWCRTSRFAGNGSDQARRRGVLGSGRVIVTEAQASYGCDACTEWRSSEQVLRRTYHI